MHVEYRKLPLVLVGNGLMRISSGASGILVGLYLEMVIAMKNRLKLNDLAGTIHAYPTYSTGLQFWLQK